jgi:curved DNA-binding protein CbpA
MRNFYAVLRVAPKASEAEIKTAFRNLAKTCHPDVRPGDPEAEKAFQEARRAYRFLSNPETRKVYDRFLANRRALERQRLRRAAATMSASFVLTAAAVFVAMLWLQQGSLPGLRALAEAPVAEIAHNADAAVTPAAPTHRADAGVTDHRTAD